MLCCCGACDGRRPALDECASDDSGSRGGSPRACRKERCQSTGPTKAFTEEDVNAAVKTVIDERSKDGAFVFRDPKLNADLNLVFEQIKIVRGMEGYGWFANTIFHDKDNAKKQYAIDFWFKPDGKELKLMDIRVQKGPKQEGDGWTMITRMPVAWWWLPVQEHPGRHGGDPRLAGDERHPQLHRHA